MVDDDNCNTFSYRPTPILIGEDAIRFNELLKENETKKIDPKKIEIMRKNFEKVMVKYSGIK